MKKPLFKQFSDNLQKQVHAFNRQVRRRKSGRERAQREQEVLNLARRERAARSKSAKIRSARRSAAQQWADLQETLRWTSFQQSLRKTTQQTLKKTQQAVRAARTQNPKMRRFGIQFVMAVAVCSLIANFVLYNRYSSTRSLVRVGHRVVRKGEYQYELDNAAGKAVLSKIVYAELINQAAAKAGVMPSEKDITVRLTDLRRRKPGTLPGEDTPALRSEVGQILALENLRMAGVTASDAEIAAYYDAHRADFTLPPQAQASLVVAENLADAKEAVQLLGQEMPESAIAAHHGLHVAGIGGFQVNMNALPPGVRSQLTAAVMAMKTGEIKSFTLGKTFLIFRMKNHDAGAVLSLSQVRDQVARQVKLQKAPNEQQQMVALYKSNKPVFDMTNYKSFFSDLENAANPPKSGDAAKTASLPQQ